MKHIDQTPYRSASGQIAFIDQLRAVFKFGAGWTTQVRAQDAVVAVLGRTLERHFILLQNVPLPGTEVRLPLVLVGPAGVYLFNVIPGRGMYRARGDEWSLVEGARAAPAPVNMLTRTARLAAGLQKFLDRQGFKDMVKVEGMLLASDPGLHVDSARSIVRVVMNDALERFAVSLNQSRLVLSPEAAATIVDRITNPVPPRAVEGGASSAAPVSEPERTPVAPVAESAQQPAEWDAAAFGFDEMRVEAEAPATPPVPPARPAPAQGAARPRSLPLTNAQLGVLAAMMGVGICLVSLMIIYILFLM